MFDIVETILTPVHTVRIYGAFMFVLVVAIRVILLVLRYLWNKQHN